METKYIVNFSGGKDSTAMLLWLLDREYPIDYIVFCDTGVEFPEVYEHTTEKLEKQFLMGNRPAGCMKKLTFLAD